MRKGLGKGLDALLSSASSLEEKNNVIEVKINEVEPNKDQPRKTFDEEKLKNLAESIKEHGVVQPIIVRKEDNRYIIVAGERRWRASKLANLKTVPVIVKNFTPRELLEIALIENLQREDLNPIEEAEAFSKLIEEFNMTQEEVGKVVGKSRAAVANSVRLLSLAEEIKEMLKEGKLTSGHARTLVTIEDPERQKEIAEKIVAKNLNVREAEILAAGEQKKKNKNKVTRKENIEVSDLEEKLKSIYGTKVNLIKGRNKGKIVFEYYSKDEFERIIEILLNYGK
ncbi:MAG: ParB/RepB/Spo0J family partition protein [Clostridiaceae bacterium]|nr:ParB/RepB/Spo0J family partition protein [Clostridiaceae bacterium]